MTAMLDYPKAEIVIRDSWRAESCAKEPETVAWIERVVKKGDVFYDIGANIGAYTLVAAAQAPKEIGGFAFEPAYNTYAHLVDNLRMNPAARQMVPLQIALSHENGRRWFNYSSTKAGEALHSITEGPDAMREWSQPMLMYKLDDLRQTFDLPTPTHMKIDTDGHEFQVLQGAKLTLLDYRLKTVMVEIDDGAPNSGSIVQLMQRSGLNHFEVFPRNRKNVFNYLFER